MTTGRIQRGYLFGIAWQQTEPDETWFQSTCAYLWAPGADSRGAHVVTTWFVLGTGKTCRTCESFSTMMNEMTHLFQYCQKRVILLLHPNHLPLFSKSLSSVQFSSVIQSCPTLWDPHGLQHARLPCPSPTPRACSNSSPSSWWCHPIISSSVIPFSSCLQSSPASGSFPMSHFFTSGGQSIGALV